METEMNADMMLEEYRRYLIYNEKSKSTVSKYVRDAGKFLDFLQTAVLFLFAVVGERKTK